MAGSNLVTYVYKAKTRDGRFLEGKVKADSTQAVVSEFMKRGITPLEIKEEGFLDRDFQLRKPKIKSKEVAAFMRQVATMTGAGITISRSLEVLRDQAANPALKDVLAKVRQDIDIGLTLAQALNKHPEAFSPLTVSMVRAGEAGGFLTPDVLISIAEGLETEARLRGKIKSAITYPAIVASISLIMVTGILIFVVPIFGDIFAEFGQELPLPTQIMVSFSQILQVIIVPLIIGIIALVSFMRKNKNNRAIRDIIDPIKTKLPVFGTLIKKIVAARFARNFGSLLSAGLPVMQVMDVVGATSGSVMVEDAMEDVKKYVSVGELIAPQLRRHAIFPKLLVEMMAVGEESGELPMMMSKIAESYDQEVEAMADQLTSLLEPLLLVTLGVIVGVMVIALYLPIFGIYGLF